MKNIVIFIVFAFNYNVQAIKLEIQVWNEI